MNAKSLVAAVGLVLITTLGFFYLPWADDFCSIVKSQTASPWEYALDYYYKWDGRIFNYFVQAILSSSFLVLKYSVFVWITFFFLMIYLVQKIISPNKGLYFFFFLSILFWLGFRRHISETVYWSTGGGYIFATFLGLVWMYLYDKKKIETKTGLLAWSAFSFIAGINSFSLSPALITYITWEKLVLWYRERTLSVFEDKKFLLSFAFVLIGTLIIITAPGNFVRATASEESFKGFILWNLVKVNIKFIGFGWPLVILSAIVTYIFRENIISTTPSKRFQWLFTALATASPLAALNSFTSPRTAVFFHAFFTVFLLLSFKSLFQRFTVNRKMSFALQLVLGGTFFGMIITDHVKGYKYFEEYSAQFEELKANASSKKDIVFTETLRPPKSLDAALFSEDPHHFGNVCASQYFGLKSIIYKPQ